MSPLLFSSGWATVVVVGPAAGAAVVLGRAVPPVPLATVVVVPSTCSGAPNSGAVPWKMARMAFMLAPSIAGMRTALPPMVALVLSTW